MDPRDVVAEIEAEVRHRRASGQYPPGLEEELDAVFARFAPPGALGDDLSSLLERAEQAALIDVDAPVESSRPLVPYAKLFVRKGMAWYQRHLAQQITSLGGTLVRATRLLGEQVDELREATAACAPRLLEEAARPAPLPPTVGQRAVIAGSLASARGRVCVAETADATLLDELRSLDVELYAVDPSASLASRGDLDVRQDRAVVHLRRLPPGRLGAVVLMGLENMPAAVQLELLDRSLAAISAEGLIIVVSIDPRSFDADGDGLRSDLAVGRPLRASTWQALGSARGLAVEVTNTDPPDYGRQPKKQAEQWLGTGPYVAVLRRPAEA
ncbi:MAG: hypothetical protein JWL70_1052 [Acidimicrobiia bacterium]|nr:hypothetical protein [Acidimicrobiia bacterium]